MVLTRCWNEKTMPDSGKIKADYLAFARVSEITPMTVRLPPINCQLSGLTDRNKIPAMVTKNERLVLITA